MAACHFSLSDDLSHYRPDEALQEFHVPRRVFQEWKDGGAVQTITDLHRLTGKYTDEIRIMPPVSGELNKYRVQR